MRSTWHGSCRKSPTPLAEQDWPFLEMLLEVADSSVSYRTRYFTTLQPLAVLDLLMADEMNPRSLDFQLRHLADLYEKLPRHLNEDVLTMRAAVSGLRRFNLSEVQYPLPGSSRAATGFDGLSQLERFLKETELMLPAWSNNLSIRYFSHARTLPTSIYQ